MSKKMSPFFAVLFLLFINSHLLEALPLDMEEKEELQSPPEFEGDYFEGDMILNEEQQEFVMNSSPNTRNIIMDSRYRWPNATIPYTYAATINEEQIQKVRKAMDNIASKTCLHFVEVTNATNIRLNVISTNVGCNTQVGYQGKLQTLNLATGCYRQGSLLHELLHVAGFYHQQSSPARDRYVRINYENIQKEKRIFFRIIPHSSDFGVGYDIDSVMHYGMFTFSKNGKPTIEPLCSQAKIGKRTDLSEKDIKKINIMYKCPTQ